MDLRHVLITRFNLATAGREVAFRERPGWLESRFELFERHCLPSVAAQSEQAFDWIVYFDEHTPGWARDRIARLQDVRAFRACYTALFDASGWARTVRETIGEPVAGRVIVTSNLDNDDGLAVDHIARVQQAVRQGGTERDGARYAVNVPNGYVLQGRALFAHRHLSNAFSNLVEPDDASFATVMTIRHMELHAHVPVVQAEGPGTWLQIVHDGNVSNRVRGRRVGGNHAAGRFAAGVTGPIDDPSPWLAAYESLLAAPFRYFRDKAFALARRIVPVDR